MHEYQAHALDPLWEEDPCRKLSFVLARYEKGRNQAIATTDLTLTAAQAIDPCSLR